MSRIISGNILYTHFRCCVINEFSYERIDSEFHKLSQSLFASLFLLALSFAMLWLLWFGMVNLSAFLLSRIRFHDKRCFNIYNKKRTESNMAYIRSKNQGKQQQKGTQVTDLLNETFEQSVKLIDWVSKIE